VATRFFEPAPPRVIAHRGLTVDASGSPAVPENTLAAFQAALDVGVTHLETDVRASRDGVAVISHDPDFERLLGRTERVAELTLAELGAVDLGGGHRMPTLAEALEAFPGACFNIDIKSADAILPTVEAIRDAQALDRVLVTSFSETRRLAALALLPGVATSAAARRIVPVLYSARVHLPPLVRLLLKTIDAVQVPQTAAGVRTATPRMLRLLHSAGVEVHIWTVNEPREMERLFALGVDGVVTDRADLALRVLGSRG